MDDDEMLTKLREHRRNILLTLRQRGELPMGALREEAGFPAGSRNHHTGILQEWGLIEVIGRLEDGGDRVFDLTRKGHEFVETHLEGETPTHLEERVRIMENRIVDLEESKLDAERFELLKEYLQHNYKDEILAEIEEDN